MPEHITGTVRFSVESLLYYAPKITRTGEELASATAAVQRSLLGLGDFFGNSWPDQPFRDSYPRAQYALLIIAAQLADEIQGIGGGIAQMARNYGITENQNTADITRIQQDEGRTNMTLHHTGGLPSPPDKPIPFSGAPDPSTIPHPQAGPSPAPAPSVSLGAAAGQAVTAASFTTSPGAYPTPSPEPGPVASKPTSWGKSLFDVRVLEGPWPSGDPGRMEEAADCWNRLITALDDAWTDLQRYTTYILADCQGPAADAFQDYVDGLTATGHGSLTRAIESAQDLRNACLKQADEVRNLRRTMEQTAAELVAAFVIGQVVSVLTFESTQALSDAIDAGIAAKFTQLAARCAEAGIKIGEELKSGVLAVSKVFSQAFAAGWQSAFIGGMDIGANDIIGEAFGQKPESGTKTLLGILEAGGVGTILGQGSAGGLFGLGAAAASKKLIGMGEVLQQADRDSTTAKALVQIGLQLKDGGITVSAANAALTQLITQQELTPVTFISSTVSNRFTTAITPAPGRHSRNY